MSINTAVPLGATNGSVTVTVGGQTSNGVQFTVETAPQAPPTLAAISPNTGSQLGGQQVTITGTGFSPDTRAFIRGQETLGTVVVDPTTIRATTPASAPGAAEVRVTNASGDARLPGGYTYLATNPLRLIAITPTPGLTNAPVNAPVTVLFNRGVDPATITVASLALRVSSSGAAVTGTFTFDQDNALVVFRPSANLAPSTSYMLTVTRRSGRRTPRRSTAASPARSSPPRRRTPPPPRSA